ncbi:MAG: hypothetical protein WCF16_11935 [Alphaproteobacteria bacterium]
MANGNREVILEFQTLGNAVKVTAVDTATLIEVSIVGPPSAGEEALKRTVLRKLDYVLAQRGLAPLPRSDT